MANFNGEQLKALANFLRACQPQDKRTRAYGAWWNAVSIVRKQIKGPRTLKAFDERLEITHLPHPLKYRTAKDLQGIARTL